MNELEQKLLTEESGGAEPTLCIRSGTKVDTGRWWRPTPMWLCIVGDELLTLAVSRRRYFARLPVSECSSSYYSHTTGEFVIEPAEDLKYKRFKVTPLQALELLKAMGMPQWEGVVPAEQLQTTEDASVYEQQEPAQELGAEEGSAAEPAEVNDLNATE